MPTRRRAPKKVALSSVAWRWMIVRVVLVAKADVRFSPPPGRDLLLSSSHTFAELAAAIDRAFARWDLSHLHEFRLSDGRVIGMADADEFGDSEDEIEEREMTLGAAALAAGDSFTYVFDFGDGWEHHCTVLRDDADPVEEYGRVPEGIVPIFGWGTLPDQYGRSEPDAAADDSDRD